jgi:hypothetical protein
MRQAVGHVARPPIRIAVVVLAWLATLAVDFALHGGLLAPVYDWSSPFLIPPLEAFARIPVAYAALLVLAGGLAWLLPRLAVTSGWGGARIAAAVGLVGGGAFLAALWSISTAGPGLLIGWWIAIVGELGVAGWILGESLAGRTVRSLLGRVLVLVIAGVTIAVALQSIGYADTVPIPA